MLINERIMTISNDLVSSSREKSRSTKSNQTSKCYRYYSILVKLAVVFNLFQLVLANPVFVSNPSIAHFQSGRNIRHLPCVVRKSGLSGVCMFAIDCIKANGTHLGTCIDRFYFGSCCQIQDVSAIVDPEISDNSIDQNTISHYQHESTTLTASEFFQITTPSSVTGSTSSSVSEIIASSIQNLTTAIQNSNSTIIPIYTKPIRPIPSPTTAKTSNDESSTSPTPSTSGTLATETTLSTMEQEKATESIAPITTTDQPKTEVTRPTTIPTKMTTFQIVHSEITTIPPPSTLALFTLQPTTMPPFIPPPKRPIHRPTTTEPPTTVDITTTTSRPTTTTTTRKPTHRPYTTTTKKTTNKRPASKRPTTSSSTNKKPSKRPTTQTTNKRNTTKRPANKKPTKPVTRLPITTPMPLPMTTTRAPRPKPKPTAEIVNVPATTTPVAITTTEEALHKEEPTTTETPVSKLTTTSSTVEISPTTESSSPTTVSQSTITTASTATIAISTTSPKPITSPAVETTVSSSPPSSSTAYASTTVATTTTTTKVSPTKEPEIEKTTEEITTSTAFATTSTSTTTTTASTTSKTSTTSTTEQPIITTTESPTTMQAGLVTWTTVEDPQPSLPNISTTANQTDGWSSIPPTDWVPLITISPAPNASNAEVTPILLDEIITKGPELIPILSSTSSPIPASAFPETSSSPMIDSTTNDILTTVTENLPPPSLPAASIDSTTEGIIASGNLTLATGLNGTEATPVNVSTSTYPPVSFEGIDYRQICGKRMFPEPRIVGGSNAAFGRWPWQISLRQWRTSTYLHKCGAALLNENWAITAAHCVDNVPPSDLLLRLGEYDLAEEEEPYGYQERRVQIVASHPQFDPRTFEYDLALLRFYEPVAFQPNIIPVCVPEDDRDFIGQTAYVTGWGRLYEDGPLPSVLQEVSVPVINNTICETMYRNAGYIEHIPHIFICAGWKKGGYDSCEGDSGGPMVLQRDDKRFQLGGVISWGIGCAEPNQPGVYTRISEFRDWINQILQF